MKKVCFYIFYVVKYKKRRFDSFSSTSKKLCFFPIDISNHDWLLAKWKSPITRGNPEGHWFKHFFLCFFSSRFNDGNEHLLLHTWIFRNSNQGSDFLLQQNENHFVLVNARCWSWHFTRIAAFEVVLLFLKSKAMENEWQLRFVWQNDW